MAVQPLFQIRDAVYRRTKQIVLWTSLIHEPFLALYAWVPFILRKDLGASVFEVGVLLTLKPLVSVFSFYWIAASEKKSLRTNLLFLGVLGRIPFLLFFWIDQIGFIIFAAALYLLLSRAAIAPWMEILKRNLPKKTREKTFTLGSAIGYAEGVLLALSLGFLLDMDAGAWKVLFFMGAALGIFGVFLQVQAPIETKEPSTDNEPAINEMTSLKEFFLKPWRDCLSLMRTRKDFAQFQWGFMACGCGVMMAIAILPFYFVDVLNLSHMNFATARQICMGLGFVVSSIFWAKALSRQTIPVLTMLVCSAFGVFSACLIFASIHLAWLYVAYAFYGIAQGGSHNLWHLSGPMFAKDENSQKYIGVNVMAVGIRGLVIPSTSLLLCSFIGPLATLFLSMLVCFSGGVLMMKRFSFSQEQKTELED